jgi:hypothetical protein
LLATRSCMPGPSSPHHFTCIVFKLSSFKLSFNRFIALHSRGFSSSFLHVYAPASQQPPVWLTVFPPHQMQCRYHQQRQPIFIPFQLESYTPSNLPLAARGISERSESALCAPHRPHLAAPSLTLSLMIQIMNSCGYTILTPPSLVGIPKKCQRRDSAPSVRHMISCVAVARRRIPFHLTLRLLRGLIYMPSGGQSSVIAEIR